MQPIRMPYSGRHVPHAVIEVNQKCNISCKACYKDKSRYSKPLQQILDEIDLVLTQRRCTVITLAGGEPTLHPELPQVMEHLRARGVEIQMLSNGYSLNDEMLQRFKQAGLSKIYLHVDSMQRRPDAREITSERDLHALRQKLAETVTRNGIDCALSLTLYQENFPDLTSVVELVSNQPELSRLLVTCCNDFSLVADRCARPTAPVEDLEPSELQEQMVTNAQVAQVLEEGLGMEPYAYLGSTRDRSSRRWLFYYAFTISRPDAEPTVLHTSPAFGRLVVLANFIGRVFRGRYPFDRVISGAMAVLVCLLYAALSLSPKTMLEVARFLRQLRQPGARIDQKSFIFQQGPNPTAHGIEYCQGCPDATIRNGELVPVCMADILSPLPEEVLRPAAAPRRRRTAA